MESSSRRAAQFGLGAAIILLVTCVTLIVGAAVHAGPSNIPQSAISQSGQPAVIR